MRRPLILIVLAVLALAGCGSSTGSSGSARDAELSYFPAGSPAVALLATDPNGTAYQDARGFTAKLPIAKIAIAALESSLAGSNINIARDIQPLLGNPVAVGASTAATTTKNDFLVAFVAKDASKLAALVKRPPARSAGSHDGAQLYQEGGGAVIALDGATAVLSRSPADIKSALDLHAHGGGITSSEYAKAMAGLPQNTLLQVYGNLSGLLGTGRAAMARQVPWVAAIRSYAATVSVTDTGITGSFRVDTSGRALTASQLPLATGPAAPGVVGQAPVAVGLKDLAHMIAFGRVALQATDRNGLAKAMKSAAKDGVDLNRDVLSQFTGDGEVDHGPTGVLLRADIRDPAGAQRTLAKLKGLRRIGGGFYEKKNGSATYGVVGSRLVIGNAKPAALAAFAQAPASPIASAPGPLAFRVSVGALIGLAINSQHLSAQANQAAIASLANMFGPVTGYAVDDPSVLRGSFTLPLK